MALIVEDGTGKPDAESYVSVAEADAYHAARGVTSWSAAAVDAREAALRNGTSYVDAMYAWKGAPTTSTQALAWPRTGVEADGYEIATDFIPPKLRHATCEAALKSLTSTLVPDVSPQQVVETTVGPITKKYAATERNGGQVRYPFVDALLRGLVEGGMERKLVRV